LVHYNKRIEKSELTPSILILIGALTVSAKYNYISCVFLSDKSEQSVSFLKKNRKVLNLTGFKIYVRSYKFVIFFGENLFSEKFRDELWSVRDFKIFPVFFSAHFIRQPRVNFTNVLHAAFMYVSCTRSFFCLRFSFVVNWRMTVGAKAARRMLMKLSPRVSFTNHLLAAAMA
jgi:hypothetical protein